MPPDIWSCPLPLRDYPHIVMGHGGGGRLSADLVNHLFLPAFASTALNRLADATVVGPLTGRLAVSTDSFVVRPLFFPGGSIGDLAVHGTVNDLAMAGAQPRYLTVGFILEEGLPMATLGEVVARMAAAARHAGVTIIAGDTKVVERGHGDGLYINTTGLGELADSIALGPDQVRPGDRLLLSGTLGDHGMAILSVREGLEFDTVIESDCASLHGLTAAMLAIGGVRLMRDPTRGGLSASLNELAVATGCGMRINEPAIPVRGEVAAACELLGLDVLHVANEGKLVAIVDPERADALLAAMRAHPLGANAVDIGEVTATHAGLLLGRTAIGGTRVIPLQLGQQLPRIC